MLLQSKSLKSLWLAPALCLGLSACDSVQPEDAAGLAGAPEAPGPAAIEPALTATVDFGGGPQEISYHVDEDGMAILGDDMVLGPAEMVASGRLSYLEVDKAGPPGAIFSAISHLNSWPGGQVRFVIDPVPFPVGSAIRGRIDAAIASWNAKTIVRLLPHNTSNPLEHFVTITSATASMSTTEGQAAVGFQPLTTQRIRLGSAVPQRVIEHEIGHAVGLFHEQSRTDRDNFVTVNLANVMPGKEGNFMTFVVSGAVGLNFGNYDINSLMHYGSFLFAVDPTVPTLVDADCQPTSVAAGCTFGGGATLTTADIAGVTRLVTGDPVIKFKLRNDGNGQCLRPENNSRSNGAAVVLSNCSESTSRRWYPFKRPGTDQAMIINENSRLCLAMDDNGKLIQATCDGSSGQRLTFLSAGLFSPGELIQRGSRCLQQVSSSAQPSWSTSCQDSASRRWHKDLL